VVFADADLHFGISRLSVGRSLVARSAWAFSEVSATANSIQKPAIPMSGKPNRDEIARLRSQVLQTIMPSTSFRGSLASHIRECKMMGSLEDYDRQFAAITAD
jgi:hypothetical protein